MNQGRIWRYYQNEGVAAFDQALPRYRYICERVWRRLPPGKAILNIGIGSGALERMLAGKGYRVTALDPDAESVARLRRAGIDASVGIAEQLPFADGIFDAVVASEVLEHISADVSRHAVGEISRTLRPGGLLLGTVPYRERMEDNVVVCPDCGREFHRWGHQQAFDLRAIENLLGKHFDILSISRRSFVPWTLEPLRLLKSVSKWLLGRAGETIASPHFHFECRKRAD